MDTRLILFIALAIAVYAQVPVDDDDPCTEQTSCGDCMAASPTCAWCAKQDFSLPRCSSIFGLGSTTCGQMYRVFTQSTIDEYIRDEEPKDAVGDQEATQMRPQEIRVTLRPNVPLTVKVTYRQAKDFPVDLYYLMDLSQSMQRAQEALSVFAVALAREMREITANFKLGFGSYIDKPLNPYISVIPASVSNPCATRDCVPAYAFKNQLPLTYDATLFSNTVGEASVSGNLDNPEGTLDAMMQAAVCKEQIGWRNVSRKILLVSTDANFHMAGDGRLAGLVKPHDGLCHLNDKGEDPVAVTQDYPSVSHIGHVLHHENILVIFAIYPRYNSTVEAYQQLARFIPDAEVLQLKNKSSNVVQLIKDSYEKMSGKIELNHEAPDDMDISYRSSCLGETPRDTSSCEGLKSSQQVTFDVTLSISSCPVDAAARRRLVKILPAGLADQLIIHVDVQCECDCEQSGFQHDLIPPPVPASPQCSARGTYQCGQCACDEGLTGKDCSCVEDQIDTCKMTSQSEVCEGQGECVCGTCDCHAPNLAYPDRRYNGQFCQCDDFSCDNFMGQLCGGRGLCICGMCQCQPEYSGLACECPTSTDTCTSNNGLVCGGHGSCVCGRCRCEAPYQGNTCEFCPTCPGPCEVNKPCVQCKAFQTGPYSDADCAANCTHVQITQTIDGDAAGQTCKFRDEDDCEFYFLYFPDSGRVIAQQHKECPEPVNTVAIIAGVVGAILCIGIVLLIIWKVVVTIYDKREYEKFELERNRAKWNENDNPLYKPSTSTFKNPAYANRLSKLIHRSSKIST